MVQFLPTLRALACKHSQSFLRVGLECSFKSKLRQSCHYSFWCNTPGRLSVSAEPRAFLFKWNTGYCPASSVRSTRSLHNSTILQCSKAAVDTPGQSKVEQLSRGDRILRFIGWLGGFYSRKAVLTRSAKALYESCVDTVQYEEFFNACNLPDTFQSWFLIAHLHVWLSLVRLKREGKDGILVIREVVSTFWYDVEQRMKILGVHSSSVASWSLKELTHEFYGLTIAYEEGLLSGDKVLAAALWRNLIHDKSSTDPAQLARLVDYVRRQVKHMDGLDSEHLLNDGRIKLLTFSGASSN